MRAIAFAVALLALALPALALGDIGVRGVEPKAARPGEVIRVTVIGFLGARPWPAMPVVLVAAARAPRPTPCGSNGLCLPRLYLRQLDGPPYRLLGFVRNWRPIRGSKVSARAVLSARVPRLAPGRYLLGLFCERCSRGPKGSLIIDYGLVATVRR